MLNIPLKDKYIIAKYFRCKLHTKIVVI
jgi:hypothetical protein